MSQVWSIIIRTVGKDSVRFDPDVFGIGQGTPLKAQVGDLVSWNNQSEWRLEIGILVNGRETFRTTSIFPGSASHPGYVIQEDAGKSISYSAYLFHFGTILGTGVIEVVRS